ncbi:MAG: hypothetical protein WC457_03945 [Patescibacteria group bacterium]
MAIDEADEKLEKERTDAARLAEVRAADRHRAEVAMQSQNEERNRAPSTNEEFPELVRQTEYGGIQNESIDENQDEDTEDENSEEGQPGTQQTSRDIANAAAQQDRVSRMSNIQSGSRKREQEIKRRSERRVVEMQNDTKKQQKIAEAANISCFKLAVGCILWIIPFFGWAVKIIIRIRDTKARIDAAKAKIKIAKLEEDIKKEKKKMQDDLKEMQRQAVQQMQK